MGYILLEGANTDPEKLTLATVKGQAPVKELPGIVYLLLEVHCWIYKHCKAANPNDGREADIPEQNEIKYAKEEKVSSD
jgi:hypothetical protein